MSTSKGTDLLAPFEIWDVLLHNQTIKFHKPLVVAPEILPPESEDDKTYLTADVPELNISAHGKTRQELWECVLGDIRFHWTEYVCEDDAKLAPRAKAYKDAYLSAAEVLDE